MSVTDTLSHQQLLQADRDHKKAAKVARLIYVDMNAPGILRVKKGKGYSYYLNDELVQDEETLERIKKLAIPPSWSEVWICSSPDGHIQATGLDLNGRKQYRYHATWHTLRNETKFHRLYEFGKALPRLRRKVQKDMDNKELSEDKVLAAAISLMEKTYIRVGNNDYEKLYGSYGLTTLKDNHVSIKKDELRLCFTGKKGIEHEITLKNKKLARIVKQCRDIPGKKLFQYYDAEGNKKSIDSGMLNNYIRNATSEDFSAKDFRTWAGSLQAVQCLRTLGECIEVADIRKNIVAMLDLVSEKLGNSRNICKKYYVHPGLVRMYEENKLLPCVEEYAHQKKRRLHGLSADEQLLLFILEKCF